MRTYAGVALLSALAWLLGTGSDTTSGTAVANIALIFFVISVVAIGIGLIRQGQKDGARERQGGDS